MKDKIILPDIAFNATGKCTLQYTDPDTGKVMFETSGNNHVFIKQVTGTTGFQGTALRADLLLCQGGYDPGNDLPVIPGDPIGYGRVGEDGTGLFRGTYRTADSYYNKKSLAKVSNKYVYDFLPNQALGRADWIGLTSALEAGRSDVSWSPPHMMDAPTQTYKAYNCETGDFFLTETSGNKLYLIHANTFTDTAERRVMLSELGTWYSGTAKVCVDAINNRVYVLVAYKTSSSGLVQYKCVLMKEDLSGVESVSTVTSGGSYIEMGYHGGAADGKARWVDGTSTSAFYIYTLDLETMTCTSKIMQPPTNKNYLLFDPYTIHVYRNFIWYAPRYFYNNGGVFAEAQGTYFVYTAPMVDVATGEVSTMMPPRPYPTRYYYQYRCGLSPYKAFSGQWVSYSYTGATPTINTAYTKYHVPEETPDRPEGMGMTVTYELEIEW